MLFFSVSCEHEVSLLTLTQFPLFFCKEEEDFNITTFQLFSIENKTKVRLLCAYLLAIKHNCTIQRYELEWIWYI